MFSSLKNNLFIIFPLVIALIVSCNNPPKSKKNKTEVFLNEYNIECDSADFAKIYNNYAEDIYISIKISFNGESRTAKMRLRGDTSRKDPKKSFKIKFDSLLINNIPKTLNLNAEYADKTYIRQYLSSELMSLSEQVCYKTKHVKISINGNFYGLYLQVENIDNDFLKRNYLSTKGNLYKATKDGACLSIFDDFDLKWEKKTNKKSDHNDLIKLISDINNVSDDEYQSFIKKTFEYDELINLLAMNMLLSNSSTYYHNYYLYHDLYNDGKWKMLPWDMDKTLSYYNWMPYTYHRTSSEWESDNPLVERAILCKPMFNDIKKRIHVLHKTIINNDYIAPLIDSLENLLSDIVPLDNHDNIEKIEDWKKNIAEEKNYPNNHNELLQKQFAKQPLSFNVYRFDKIQTDTVTFKWKNSFHPANKKISYILSYGTDFLLQDSSKTTYISNIKNPFYQLNKKLADGIYYWKVTAFDGEFFTDGFNTKNVFEVKTSNLLPATISKNTSLIKANSPYVVAHNMVINPNTTLTIEPGVEIHLKKNVVIECNGNIIANGSSENPIVFTPDNTAEYWGHIYFYEAAKKGVFKNVIFKEGVINSQKTDVSLDYCSVIIDKKPMAFGDKRIDLMYSDHGVVTIKNSSFKGNGFGEGLNLFFGESTVENCFFDNIPDAVEYIQINKGLIRNNLIINSPDDAIDLNACNNILIEKNILLNNKDKAISIGTEQYGPSIKNIEVKHNLMIGNNMGIGIKDSSVAKISNNTLFKNNSGIKVYKKREDFITGGTAFITNTIFSLNQTENIFVDKWSSAKVSYSMSEKKLAGEGNISKSSNFVDADRYDFHLKHSSTTKDPKNLGAFNLTRTCVGLSKIHVNDKKEDWIEIINNYNIPIDLSLYKIVITTGQHKKEFTFPIGTIIPRLESLFIVNDYSSFIKKHEANLLVLGDLPNLTPQESTVELFNQNGYLLDLYKYSNIPTNKKQATFVSERSNDIKNNSWKIITD
jgi:hypothetical protein